MAIVTFETNDRMRLTNDNASMKIYTRTGDDGTTGLLGGSRTRKSDPRIECCGAIDELCAAIGLASSAPLAQSLLPQLRAVENDLFVIGSNLASPSVSANVPPLDPAIVPRLENEIDQADAQLPALHNFIIPSGCELATRLHLARAICRRAERLVVGLALQNPMPPVILPYLNRLSDWLFTLARVANRLAGEDDIPWPCQ